MFYDGCREPSVTDQKMRIFFATDGATQTEDTQIVEVKEVTKVIKSVLHVMPTDIVCLCLLAWCVIAGSW